MQKERLLYLDVIRVLACMMVVAAHSPIRADLTTATDTYLLAPFTYLMSPCNGLFFMISGALLLKERDVDYKDFLQRRLSKILMPMIFWTVVFMIIQCIKRLPDIDVVPHLCRQMVTVVFASSNKVNGAYWFLYVLIGIYFLVPIISPWWKRASKKEIEFYLALWVVTTFYPYLRQFIEIPANEWNMLYYFHGYLGYFILGAYLVRFPISRDKVKYVLMCGVAGAALLPGAVLLIFHELGDGCLWCMSISSSSMCLIYFVLIQQSRLLNSHNKLTLFTSKVAPLTFGIYLIHFFGLWTFQDSGIFTNVQYAIAIPSIFVLTYVSVGFCCWLISKLPKSSYIIGV